MNSSGRTLLLLALLSSSALAVPGYLPHQTNPDIFRPDLISLTQGQMKSAAQHLINLAKRSDSTTPEDLRTTAQLIALAERLSPGNKAPKQLTDTLKDENKNLPKISEDEVKKSTQLLFSYTEWLINKNASQESQRLGKLILDPLSYLFPNEPLTKAHHASDQEIRWANVVPSITAYRKVAKLGILDAKEAPVSVPSPVEEPTANEEALVSNEEMEKEQKAESSSEAPEITFHHEKLSLRTPIAVKSSSDTRVIRLIKMELNTYLREGDDNDDYSQIASYPSNILVEGPKVEERLRASWTHQFKTQPKGRNFNFKTSKPPGRKHNASITAAPMAALLHASATEGTFRDNLILIGDLKDNGEISKPKRMWTYLRNLKAVEKSRILVAEEALADFTGFLVLNNPEFFITNEVFGVNNLQEILDLSIEERQPEKLTEALALHAEILKVAETKDIRDLATNIHVRERLKKIKLLAPNFGNADLLLLQGSGNRPTKYNPEQFAEEAEIFLLFLRPIAIKYSPSDLNYHDLKAKEDLFEEKLEDLKKLTAFGERELFDKVETLYARFRTLTRECRTDQYDEYERKEKAFESFKAVYKELSKEFSEIHDEAPDHHFFKQDRFNLKKDTPPEDDPF